MAHPWELVVESKEPYTFAATSWYLDRLGAARRVLAAVIGPREPGHHVLCLAQDATGHVTFEGVEVTYEASESPPVAGSDAAKPEPFRRLVLRLPTGSPTRGTLLRLLGAALDAYREHLLVTSAGGDEAGSVLRYVWDDDDACWSRAAVLPRRGLGTLFLPGGHAEGVARDLETFVSEATRAKYAALHVAPTRLYLLHGRPGSGKSSLCHCLASSARLSMAVVAGSASNLPAAVRTVPPRCILCLEDVDCTLLFGSHTPRTPALAALLEALDQPRGRGRHDPLPVVMTANAAGNALADVVRRRVDYALEFGSATEEQCAAMFATFFPGCPAATFQAAWETAVACRPFSTSAFHKYLVKALQDGDPLAHLDRLRELCAATAPSGSPTLNSIYG